MTLQAYEVMAYDLSVSLRSGRKFSVAATDEQIIRLWLGNPLWRIDVIRQVGRGELAAFAQASGLAPVLNDGNRQLWCFSFYTYAKSREIDQYNQEVAFWLDVTQPEPQPIPKRRLELDL